MKHHYFKLMLVMFFCMMAKEVSAHDFEAAYNGKTIYYNITSSSDKTVEVSYWGDSPYTNSHQYTDNIVIPSTVTYNGMTYTVTSIGNYAFCQCSLLTSVEIPNSVTNIEDHAFYFCSGLKRIEIPNSVTSIGNYAFSGCTSLTSVEIGNSVTSIGNEAFYNCSGMTNIEIPNSVTNIGNYAFC